jgi:hypothetical protein
LQRDGFFGTPCKDGSIEHRVSCSEAPSAAAVSAAIVLGTTSPVRPAATTVGTTPTAATVGPAINRWTGFIHFQHLTLEILPLQGSDSRYCFLLGRHDNEAEPAHVPCKAVFDDLR